jgi:hypothetical protein
MNRRRSPRSELSNAVATFLALVSLLVAAPAVFADGEASGVVVTPPIVKPGDEILIQGFALWTELQIEVRLVGKTGASRAIGDGLTGPDGSLAVSVRLPADVPPGQYTVLVTNTYGEEAGAPVVVEPELPILPLVVLGGATLVVAIVLLAAIRRRTSGEGLAEAEPAA